MIPPIPRTRLHTLRLCCLLLALPLAGCELMPQLAPLRDPDAPLRVEWREIGGRDYESSAPGLGQGLRYQSSIGWANVYTYTGNHSPWQDGVSDPLFEPHFGEILDALRARSEYSGVRIEQQGDETIAGLEVRHARLSYAAKGRPVESHLYLTALHGGLVKIRLTLFEPVSAEMEREAGEFVATKLGELAAANPKDGKNPHADD